MTGPFLSAIVRTQGNRPVSLAEALGTLRSQSDQDLEIIVVVHGEPATAERVRGEVGASADTRIVSISGGGRTVPLNAGLAEARGAYVAFLDDDDLALPNWVSTFRRGADAAPGAVIRAACLSQRWTGSDTGEPISAIGELEAEFPAQFDLVAHFHTNATPICSVALPRQELSDMGLSFDEQLPVLEDWDLFLRSVIAFGIENLEEVTSIYRRVDRGNSFDHDEDDWVNARAAIMARLDADPIVLPAGSASALAAAHQARLDLSYQLAAAQRPSRRWFGRS